MARAQGERNSELVKRIESSKGSLLEFLQKTKRLDVSTTTYGGKAHKSLESASWEQLHQMSMSTNAAIRTNLHEIKERVAEKSREALIKRVTEDCQAQLDKCRPPREITKYRSGDVIMIHENGKYAAQKEADNLISIRDGLQARMNYEWRRQQEARTSRDGWRGAVPHPYEGDSDKRQMSDLDDQIQKLMNEIKVRSELVKKEQDKPVQPEGMAWLDKRIDEVVNNWERKELVSA